ERPAEQGQVVDQRLGQDPLGAELLHGDGAQALGELAAVQADQQRQVGETGRDGTAERGEQVELAGGGGEQVVAPDDVGDAHLHVVEGGGEQVGGDAAGAQDHEVGQGGVVERDRAADQVVHDRLALVGQAEADRGDAAFGLVGAHPRGGQVAAVAVVAARPAGGQGGLAALG